MEATMSTTIPLLFVAAVYFRSCARGEGTQYWDTYVACIIAILLVALLQGATHLGWM